MTLKAFLSDQLKRILLLFFCAAAAAFFLAATGTQIGIITILLLFFLLIFGILLMWNFFCQRAKLREMEAIFQKLDQKYLFAECTVPPKNLYARRLFHLTKCAGRAMTGAVSDAQAAQREYREYIEQWVHEIKTPITAARLICCQLEGTSKRKLTFELSQIEAHVERALFYARTESPEQDCIFGYINLNKIVSKAIENHRTLFIHSGVRIETEGLDCFVYTDEKWMVFLLGQLLQNSARYKSKEPLISISARSLGRQVQLVVQDNGIGIPSHELPQVFDRGFTGSNGRSRGGSTGMGLYLCKKLSAFLQIGLELTSEEGNGTTVTLIVPSKENLTKS